MSETYLALYRKYRPQTFQEVVGQDHIVELLKNAVKNGKVPHAYLFCGGRGTGKTTVARILAKELGCNPEDIIEIDGASNRGIDEIRELREAVRTAPFSSPYKVYIIDEVHMFTKEAANALLKTLEEPPSHVIFILATTDPDRLPQTIVSRCQKITFKNPDIETLTKRLSYVVKEEGGPELSEQSLRHIAAHGKGSYRDALGILEQVLTSAGKLKNVAEEKIEAMLGIPKSESIIKLLDAVCRKDERKLVSTIAGLRGTDALTTYDELIQYVRLGILVRVGEAIENKEIEQLALEFPRAIGSKMLLGLIERRPLLEVSDAHAWTALEAITLSLIED